MLFAGRLFCGTRRDDAAKGGGRGEDATDGGGRRESPTLGRGGYCPPFCSPCRGRGRGDGGIKDELLALGGCGGGATDSLVTFESGSADPFICFVLDSSIVALSLSNRSGGMSTVAVFEADAVEVGGARSKDADEGVGRRDLLALGCVESLPPVDSDPA